MSIIKAENLTLGYNGHNIIENFSLKVPAGAVLGLIGPNGSGKTTLLRALAGLIKPFSGSVYLDEKDIWTISSRIRARQIGWVPQRERMAWALTVEEVVSLGRAPHRGWLLPLSLSDRQVIDNVLRLTELVELKERKIDKLSGGEFQRVLIARALAQEPRILLLDEPIANLDVHHQMQVMDFIRDLVGGQGITTVVAIHDLTSAARYCDQLILMNEGQQVCAGTPEVVLQSDNIAHVFQVESCLYNDPWEYLALSVRNGKK